MIQSFILKVLFVKGIICLLYTLFILPLLLQNLQAAVLTSTQLRDAQLAVIKIYRKLKCYQNRNIERNIFNSFLITRSEPLGCTPIQNLKKNRSPFEAAGYKY